MSKKELRFSYNWNQKLDCKFFTTLRLYNESKYSVGTELHVTLRTKQNVYTDFGFHKVIDHKKIQGKDLNAFICGLDTGYSVEETKGILSRMYKSKDIEKTFLSLVLLKKMDW
jgi:hypothetical protein